MRVSRILTKFEKKNLVFVVWLDLFTSYSKSNYLFSATRNHFFIHPTSTIGRPNVKAICSNQCQSNHTKILSIEWLMICCCCFFFIHGWLDIHRSRFSVLFSNVIEPNLLWTLPQNIFSAIYYRLNYLLNKIMQNKIRGDTIQPIREQSYSYVKITFMRNVRSFGLSLLIAQVRLQAVQKEQKQ